MSHVPSTPALSSAQVEALHRLLPLLAEHDRAIEPRAYDLLFAMHGVRDLFGTSAATRRQMFDDTLVGVHDLADGGAWVEEQMRSFGSRHRHTYEVTVPMYDAWRDAVVEASAEVLGPSFDDDARRALHAALTALHEAMLRGAYPRGIPR